MGDTPIVVRKAEGGHSLVVFVPSGRRSALAPGQRLEDASVTELESAAVDMTVTEMLVEVDGVSWLVQASGPVWADSAAADAAGYVFTALDGSGRRVAVGGLTPGPLPDEADLIAVLRGALPEDA